MSYWDLRQQVESAIPAWAPLLVIALVAALMVVELAEYLWDRHKGRR